jgi:hypothetical protein
MERTNNLTCSLTSLEFQKRKATIIAELKQLVVERKDILNGMSYKFESRDETLDKLNVFIKAERMCCQFFTFQLTIQKRDTLLSITGPEGANDFLRHEVEL